MVLHNEVNISLDPFCFSTPASFVRTNGGLPVKVREFIVRFVFVPYAEAHKGSPRFAYTPVGKVLIVKR